MLNKDVPAFFSNNESFIFYCKNSLSFESAFGMKTVKADYSKNICKEENCTHSFVWLATYQCKKNIENCNFVVAGAHKVGKIVFWLNFDPYFPNIW